MDGVRYTHGIERAADVIWVLTPDFYWDYADTEFNQLVHENVTRRHVRYFYLFREDRQSGDRIKEMTAQYEEAIGDSWRELVFSAAIPEEEFFWCAEQVLYNPGDPHRERAILVDTMDGRNKENKFDVELGRGRRSRIPRPLRGTVVRLFRPASGRLQSPDGALTQGASRMNDSMDDRLDSSAANAEERAWPTENIREYDVVKAAPSYAGASGLISGFALAAVVLVLTVAASEKVEPPRQIYLSFATSLFTLGFVGCLFCAFSFASLGGERSHPRR